MNWQKTVENLLNKANNPAVTEEERNLLLEKATYLAGKHSVEALFATVPTVANVKYEIYTLANPYISHKIHLIGGISTAFGCRAVRHNNQVHVFGLAEDLQKFKMLYTSLLIQGLLGVQATPVPAWEHGKTFRHSWLLGYVSEVNRRVREAANRASGDINLPGKEVVLANRTSIVDAAVADVFPSLSKGRPTPINSESGYRGGRAAGETADIGQGRVPRTTVQRMLG